jgi:hypothetical protein
MEYPSKFYVNRNRRFGLEIELNAFDGRDFVRFPLGRGELPKGMEYVCNLIRNSIDPRVMATSYHYTHNNPHWIVKPDSSCGMEICTPVMTAEDIDQLCYLVDIIEEDSSVPVDDRCSLHMHVDVSDLTESQVAAVITQWVKCEAVFIDSMPLDRKRNRYCQIIGLTDSYPVDAQLTASEVIQRLGVNKYKTVNTFHYCKRKRKTIEFRLVGAEGCTDSDVLKNWIFLILHFVDVTRYCSMASFYTAGNPHSGFCWLDPFDVFSLLGFNGKLSSELTGCRKWFLERLHKNVAKSKLCGSWNEVDRSQSKMEIDQLLTELIT